MDMKKQIEGIIRDIEIEPAWNTGFSGCAERLNDKSVENAIDKIIQIKNLSESSEQPHTPLSDVDAFKIDLLAVLEKHNIKYIAADVTNPNLSEYDYELYAYNGRDKINIDTFSFNGSLDDT